MCDLNTRLSNYKKDASLFIVSDENLADLYLDELIDSLKDFKVSYYISPIGEEAKSPEIYLDLVNHMSRVEMTRSDIVIAFGGGTVGDLAGFTAATYLRGIDLVQVPTTLLAAVDSAIGGKTAINLQSGKNLLGAFHQPVFVHTDISYFVSLGQDQIRDGLGEIIKYAMIVDETLFYHMEDPDYFKNNMEDIVRICQNIKTEIVGQDEKDHGLRRILNFGHTIGHAIETLSSYKLGHGHCVATGMLMMTSYALRKGFCKEDVYTRLKNILDLYGFETDVEKLFGQIFTSPKDQWKDQFVEIMRRDKKRKGSYIDIIVPERIGKVKIEKINVDNLGELICQV